MKNKNLDKTNDNTVLNPLPDSSLCIETEKMPGIFCTGAGTLTLNNVIKDQVFNEFQIRYITKGQGIFSCSQKKYQVSPGCIMLILPGIKHSCEPCLDGWQEYWVRFNGDFICSLPEKGYFPDTPFFQIGLHDSILLLFKQIINEITNKQPLFQFKACASILSLVAEILCFEHRKEQLHYSEKIVSKAKYLLESNVHETISLHDITEQLGISTSRFNDIFKAHTSMTPYQYFIQSKIQKAEKLLEQGNISVKEAALSLGFEDVYYFSRFFKNKTGVSPSRWKKSASGKAPFLHFSSSNINMRVDFGNGFPSEVLQSWGSGSSVQGRTHDGSKTLVVNPGDQGGAGIFFKSTILKPNTSYKLSARGKNNTQVSVPSEVGIKYRINPDDVIETGHVIYYSADVWEEKSVTFTTPDQLHKIVFFIWKPEIHVTFSVDEVFLTAV